MSDIPEPDAPRLPDASAADPVITCIRSVEFDAGHRVRGHEHKCKHVHGHRYRAELEFHARTLDTLGRVIDFGDVRAKIGGWIDREWDHALILHAEDKALGDALLSVLPFQRIYYLPYNPTAENIARYLLTEISPALFPAEGGVTCVKVTVHETPNCRAVAQAT